MSSASHPPMRKPSLRRALNLGRAFTQKVSMFAENHMSARTEFLWVRCHPPRPRSMEVGV